MVHLIARMTCPPDSVRYWRVAYPLPFIFKYFLC